MCSLITNWQTSVPQYSKKCRTDCAMLPYLSNKICPPTLSWSTSAVATQTKSYTGNRPYQKLPNDNNCETSGKRQCRNKGILLRMNSRGTEGPITKVLLKQLREVVRLYNTQYMKPNARMVKRDWTPVQRPICVGRHFVLSCICELNDRETKIRILIC